MNNHDDYDDDDDDVNIYAAKALLIVADVTQTCDSGTHMTRTVPSPG